MKINAIYLGYKEEDYVSKKSGKPATARELTVLTENKELLVFGYDSFGKETETGNLRDIEPGQAVIIECDLRPNAYNRNAPRLVILNVTER